MVSDKERLRQAINHMEKTISNDCYTQYVNIVNNFTHDKEFRERILAIDEELKQIEPLKKQISQFSIKTLYVFYKDTMDGYY